jgi:gas vesicle protein
MTLIVQIEEYLENNESYSFRRGLELYEQAGPGPSWEYLRGFKYDRSPPDQVKEKLNEELRIFLEVLIEAGAPPMGAGSPSEILPAPVKSAEPEQIKRLREEQKKLLKERDKLHAEMCLIAKQRESKKRQKELYQRASELMSRIIPRLNRIYDALEAFKESGDIPADEKASGVKLSKKLNSKRSSLSRFRRLQRKNKDHLKAQYYEQKILTIQNEIETLEEEISQL